MAKVAFSKLGLTKNTNVGSFEWNDQTIEVKAYLPIQDKMQLIQNVVYNYTNINFTEKQKSDPAKLYDLLAGSGFFDDFFAVLPQTEYKSIAVWLDKIANNFYNYRNSIYGILDALNTDYKNLELDANALKEKMADPEALGLLKQVLTNLG